MGKVLRNLPGDCTLAVPWCVVFGICVPNMYNFTFLLVLSLKWHLHVQQRWGGQEVQEGPAARVSRSGSRISGYRGVQIQTGFVFLVLPHFFQNSH